MSETHAKPADDASDEAARESERQIARYTSRGIPLATFLLAITIWATSGLGAALLVACGGVLLGVIALVWASLRTLSGDAPLADDLVFLAATRNSDASEKKRTLLRALKDLEHEHAIGKIDDTDYETVARRYRNEAKEVMRGMDAEIEPLRAKAEEAARAYLKKRGLADGDDVASDVPAAADSTESVEPSEDPAAPANVSTKAPASARASATARARVECLACKTSNEPDAQFCKSCGASMTRTACVACGASNEPDATFCKSCGKNCRASTGSGDADA